MSNTSARPSDDQRPVLRIPTSPQRESFIEEAAALLIYLDEGGAVSRLASYVADDSQMIVSFAVSKDRFWELTRELRQARVGPGVPRLRGR
jgi:hypothetical protein